MTHLAGPLWVVAQVGRDVPGSDVHVDLGTGLGGGAVGAFATTLVLGGLAIALFPTFTERTIAAVQAEPVDAVLSGIAAVLGLALVILALFLTIVGILLAIPLYLLAILVWAVGASIGFLAIGERIAGREDGWAKPLLVGAGINGALALTGVGWVVGVLVGLAGFGAIVRGGLSDGESGAAGGDVVQGSRRR